jgi:hypothetical protein
MMHIRMGDGIRRWRHGAAISSSVGRLSTDTASVFASTIEILTPTSNARRDGGWGGLVGGRSASGRDKGLSFAVAPSRLVTRCTSTRPSPRRKRAEVRTEVNWIRLSVAGRGSVYLLRGVYVSSTGSWCPHLGGPLAGLVAWVWRRTARGSSAVSCRRLSRVWDTVLGRATRSSLPEARRPFLPAGSRLSPPPSALMRISSSR